MDSPFARPLCFAILMLGPWIGWPPAVAQSPLAFDIVNQRSEDVFVYFANGPVVGTLPDSLGGGAIQSNIDNADSIGYRVAGNSTLTGFQVESFSGRVFVSCGQTLVSGNGSQFNNTSLPDYHKRFDHFEITYATNNPWSGANLTATDFFGIPLQLNNGATTVRWSQDNFASTLNGILPAIKDPTSDQNGFAIVTGQRGIPVPGIGNVVRLIAPSTAVAVPGFSPYGDIGQYHTAMQNGLIGNRIHVESNRYGNDFNLLGSVTPDGKVLLTRHEGEGSIGSLVLDSKFFSGKEIYKANPDEATIDGIFKTSFTSNESAAIRDIYAGFNLGVWGSTTPVGDSELGLLSSQEFLDLGSTEYFFQAAQSNPLYYNEFAARVAEMSDNSVYGFPYSDVLGAQFISLSPENSPVLTMTIAADAVPEPSGMLAGSLLAGPALLRRRRSGGRPHGCRR